MKIGGVPQMSAEELRAFLLARNAKPGKIKEIEQQFSPQVIVKLLELSNLPTTGVAIELNASICRGKFAERIRIYEAGGIAWDDIEHLL